MAGRADALETRVAKWGNSLAIRIPKDLLHGLGLTDGSRVEMTVAEGTILVRRPRPSLEELLARVTADNIHQEIDFGRPVGREVW